LSDVNEYSNTIKNLIKQKRLHASLFVKHTYLYIYYAMLFVYAEVIVRVTQFDKRNRL